MAKLQTLKPLAQLLKPAVKPREQLRIDATPRLRGRAWMERRANWLYSNPLCVHCQERGETRMADEVDHITPLWAGGRDDESNYQSLCKADHAAKTAAEAGQRYALGLG